MFSKASPESSAFDDSYFSSVSPVSSGHQLQLVTPSLIQQHVLTRDSLVLKTVLGNEANVKLCRENVAIYNCWRHQKNCETQ